MCSAQVDTRDEVFVNQGGPGDRQMTAYWAEDGYLLELRAAVGDQAGLEERLGWLARVDSQTWLDAMPAKVVKACWRWRGKAGVPSPGSWRRRCRAGTGNGMVTGDRCWRMQKAWAAPDSGCRCCRGR